MLEGISPPSLDDAFVDPNRHETVLASHMPAKGLDLAAAQRDGGCGQDIEFEEVAGLPVDDVAELDLEFVQHGVDLDVGLPELGGEVAFQIESRPNFSPMNICSRSSRTGSSVA